ncbi:MAG: hypothetical protein DKT66_08950 [Candidatus Melainabacteria bacterium]|nr:MAG: hypothetical protein DKT66_08950 [Candidatus Melainabacteria bacterium]
MSPESAFEELCSQISRSTPPKGAGHFVRNGTPDGGVEFYWTLKSGAISGWQCKFFQGSLTAGQWAQLDKSFKDALDNYPKLTHYIVAMPQDLAQGKTPNKKSFRERWNERVKSWTALAKRKRRNITIEFFGDAEIFHFLDTEDQAGRRWYWFEQVALTQQWFDRRMKSAIANAGARYTPELNIDVPLRRTLEFLTRSAEFRNIILTHRGKLRKASRHAMSGSSSKLLPKAKFTKLSKIARNLDQKLTQAADRELESIDWKDIESHASSLRSLLWEVSDTIKKKKEAQPIPRPPSPNEFDLMGMLLHEIDDLVSTIRRLTKEIETVAAEVTEYKALLITGQAGSGKTHILCDFAKQRVNAGLPTVLLYGEQFKDEDPWQQICTQLQLSNIGADELLLALESAGQARQERALIIIDGLNEGAGKTLWQKHLPGMLATLSSYNWIALAISLRTGFEPHLVENGKIEDLELIDRYHPGFADVEFNAIPHFCKHYGLNMPSIPVLLPEFQNPLFLKLTCESLKESKRKDLPMGISGVKSTFDAFVSSIDTKLAKRLGLDPKDKLVEKSLEALSESMTQSLQFSLPYSTAKGIVNKLSPADNFENSLFRHLISEGVLTETVRYGKDNKATDHIRFAYERFSDHLIAEHLLHGVSSLTNLKKQFKPTGPLGKLLVTSHANRGLLEALSIQIPEKFGQELYSLISASAQEEFWLAQILLSGLIWREPTTIKKDCISFLIKWANNHSMFANSLLDTLVALSPIPSHPLNADFLDRILRKQTMPVRDVLWTVFVSEYATYGRETAVGRMIDWMNEHESTTLSDDSARLYAVILTWMLSSPNRVLRDRATKALVRLLGSRTPLLTKILKHFADVDDLYVVERIFGVAYGCVLRAANLKDFKAVAEFVYDKEFRDGAPRKNILLRDHCRGIIEICALEKVIPSAWNQKATAPYNQTTLPKFPTQKAIDKLKTGKFDNTRTTLSNLYYMIMEDGDFARDVLRANLSGRWLTRASRRARAKQKGSHRWNRIGQIDWRGPHRWILKRVVDLGWTEQRFGAFDHAQHYRSSLSRYDRRFEGFDKKYTWLALYELLASLQDSADFNEDDSEDRETGYFGPWQLSYIRNIDPSRLEPLGAPPIYVGTFPQQPDFTNWTKPACDADWIKQTNDLPNPLKMIESSDWLVLAGTFGWEEPSEPGEEKYDNPRRSFWFDAQSCLVRSSDAEAVYTWLTKQDPFAETLPKSPDSHDVFLGDFFRGLAFQYQNQPYYHRAGWTRSYSDRIPAQIIGTEDGYMNESGVFDNSFEETVNLRLPCEFLVKELRLRWNGEAGWVDSKQKLIAVDPAYWNLRKCQLLFSKPSLLAFLKSKGLELIWVIRGRKNILGENWNNFAGQLEMQAICRSQSGNVSGVLNIVGIDPARKKQKLRPKKL